MVIVEQLVRCELAEETEVLGENTPQSTTNPTSSDSSLNLGGKPATNLLSYGAVSISGKDVSKLSEMLPTLEASTSFLFVRWCYVYPGAVS
jgi:hypothetical protein